MPNDNDISQDFTGQSTGHVRSGDYLFGQWNVHTNLDQNEDGSWKASAFDGKYSAEGSTIQQASEKLFEILHDEGLKGSY